MIANYKKSFLFLLSVVILVFSCKNQKKTEETGLVPPAVDSSVEQKQNYMPVAVVLRGEMKWVEDFAGAVLLKSTIDSKKDSAYISLIQFNQLANSVISPEMDSAFFNEHFKEETIADGGSEGLTFIYTGNNTRELKKVMVYITRTETSDRVGRVYFEKEMSSGDTSIVQRCTWKMQHYLMIVETRQVGNNQPSTIVRKAIYDPAEYASE